MDETTAVINLPPAAPGPHGPHTDDTTAVINLPPAAPGPHRPRMDDTTAVINVPQGARDPRVDDRVATTDRSRRPAEDPRTNEPTPPYAGPTVPDPRSPGHPDANRPTTPASQDGVSLSEPRQPHSGQRPAERPVSPAVPRPPHASQNVTGPHSGQRPPDRVTRPPHPAEYPGRDVAVSEAETVVLPRQNGSRPQAPPSTPPNRPGVTPPNGPPTQPQPTTTAPNGTAAENSRATAAGYPAATAATSKAPDPRPVAASSRAAEAGPHEDQEGNASGWFTPKKAATPAGSTDEWTGPRPAAGEAEPHPEEAEPGWFTPSQARAARQAARNGQAPETPVSPAPPLNGPGPGPGPDEGEHRKIATAVTLAATMLVMAAIGAANFGLRGVNSMASHGISPVRVATQSVR